MDQEAKENHSICFLACTRPVLYLGVTMEAFGLNVGLTMICYVVTSSWKFLGLGVGIHYVFRFLLWQDHNRFRVLQGWFETGGVQRNKAYWGGSSVSPLRHGVTYTASDLDHV